MCKIIVRKSIKGEVVRRITTRELNEYKPVARLDFEHLGERPTERQYVRGKENSSIY